MNRPLPTALGWRVPDIVLDVGPVAFIVLEGTAAIVVARNDGAQPVKLGLALAIVAAALLLRHRAPLAVLGVVLAVLFVTDYGPVGILPALLAVFTVAEYCERPQVLVASAATAAVILLTPVLHGVSLSASGVISRLVAVGLAVSIGLYLRTRADFVVGLHERAERLERERELLAQRAVGEERLRIARELHDVVAHNVSLMVVQAQALDVAASENEHEGLSQIAGLGREALSEMHRMLGVLRVHDGADPDREPQPGVRDLAALVERTRAAGLDARLIVNGEPQDLPPGIDLSAYRIVQEALTNVVRHAHASSAVVTLGYGRGALDVTVEDDGAGASNGGGSGHGLVGMRERVALLGGTLVTDSSRTGGYRVHATIPVR